MSSQHKYDMRITDLFEEDDGQPLVIKLGSKRTSTSAQRFMADFENFTQEHPFTRGMRYFEDGPVLVKMVVSDDFDDEVELMDIQSKARGAGARALKTICRIADERDVTISLYAMGYAHVPTENLLEYYARFGFQIRNPHDHVEDGVDMVRYPGAVIQEAYFTTAEMESPYGNPPSHVEIFKNPSRAEFMKAIGKAPFGVARGLLYSDGTLLVSYDEDAEHYAIDSALKGTGDFTRLFLNPKGVTFYGSDFDDPPHVVADHGIAMIKGSPTLQRIYGKDFSVKED